VHGSAGRLCDLLVQLNVDKLALIVTAVHLADVASNGGGNDTRDALDAIIGMIQLGDVDQGGDGLLGGGWDADRMQSTGEETALDLHDLGVYLAGDVVVLCKVHILGIECLKVGQVLDILVEVASPGGRHDGVNDGDEGRTPPTAGTLSHSREITYVLSYIFPTVCIST